MAVNNTGGTMFHGFLRLEAQARGLIEKRNQVEAEMQSLNEQIMQNPDLTDPLRTLLDQFMELHRQHKQLQNEIAKWKPVLESFITTTGLPYGDTLVVDTMEGAEWAVRFRQDYYWKGTALIPTALPTALRDDILAKCNAAQVPTMLQD